MARLSNFTEVLMDEKNHINITGEVLRIKEVLLHSHDQATEIGRPVNELRKHNSKLIGRLARTLIQGWKEIVDEWILTASAIPDFQAPVDTLQPVPESLGPARWPEPPQQPVVTRQAKPLSAPVAPPKPQGAVSNFAKPSISASGPSRPPLIPICEQKQNYQAFAVQRMPSNFPMDKSKDGEEALFRAKLELAKRKLREGYAQEEKGFLPPAKSLPPHLRHRRSTSPVRRSAKHHRPISSLLQLLPTLSDRLLLRRLLLRAPVFPLAIPSSFLHLNFIFTALIGFCGVFYPNVFYHLGDICLDSLCLLYHVLISFYNIL
ncbi:hypothetical protein KSP39_PZI018721 [Platanthera zijinensis]|uniref:TFIIS N-terminal domain-containing protein n=1 Tax=Platanthera zijinensis TaxID=2320716 RepID=A0AAP0B478_9ASPA